MPLADHVGLLGQRRKGGPVAFGAHGDDLAVGAVDLGTPVGQPGGEGGIQLAQRGEHPASQHMASDDLDLPLDAALVWAR